MLVSEFDPLIERYIVFECGVNVGEKSSMFGYLKPEWSRHGIRRYKTFEERKYKAVPPWFKLEVEKIGTCGGVITIHAKKKEERK